MSALRRALEARLAGLRAEAAKGEQALADLDARRLELERTMLRISGAVQVLEETLAAADEPDSDGRAAWDGSASDGHSGSGGWAMGDPAPAPSAADGSASDAHAASEGSAMGGSALVMPDRSASEAHAAADGPASDHRAAGGSALDHPIEDGSVAGDPARVAA